MDKHYLQQLIDKVLAGEVTAKEQQELDEWYAAQDLEQGLTGSLDEDDKNAMGAALYENIHHRIQRPPSIAKWMLAAAAVVLMLMVAGTFWFFSKKHEPALLSSVWKEERTGNDIRNIRLPDGSTVWLNAGTVIRYDSLFLSGKREVWLQGEGFFDVAHNAGKAFEVHTGKVTTRVLGTAFNIDAYDTLQDISVSVTRGKVTVFTAKHSSGILLPNQKVVYEAGGKWTRYDSLTMNAHSWTSGELDFRDVPFSEIAKRLERRYGVEVIFKDAGLGSCRFSGRFAPDITADAVIEMLALTNRATVEKVSAHTYYIHGTKQCK